ncbi:hypothetical protein VE04_07367 [Pseudogymnoascus sp. 24MN13]|nr:hypothetical protein VE04_07367 [Pseudogymnoascus sp. 24MN13]
MSLTKTNILELQFSLRQAVVSCSDRCQYQSAKWAAELLDALPDDDLDPDSTSFADVFNPQTDPVELRFERNELPKYLMAKALFDCHEPRRCASVFLSADSSEHTIPLRNDVLNVTHGTRPGSLYEKTSQKGLFLASYALLIAGEKEKTEELSHILGPLDTGAIVNKQLAPLKHMLEAWFDQAQREAPGHRPSQGWLEYLYGIVLAKDRNHDLAILWFLKSVLLYPWNWGAWLELSSLIRDGQHLNQVQSQLQPHIMAFIFSIHCRQELHQVSTSLVSEISQLQSVFPRSLFLQGQRALVFYRMKDLHEANTLFSEMLLSDPRRLDFLDHYSNVLYTLGSRERLAFVAQLASAVNRYRPETCCVVGNYYSLSSRHEDAVNYFRRALNLDRNFSPAWTLLGHEYFKLQNTHAAIESYRHAVDLNNKDYRAFVGLGQVYEVLEKPSFSLHYYRRAVALRPADVDLWQMMSTCLMGMSRVPQAIDALKKAITCSGNHAGNHTGTLDDARWKRIELFFHLANIYEESQDRTEAIKYLEICLDESDEAENRGNTNETIGNAAMSILHRARLMLARWAATDGHYSRAKFLASQVDPDSEFGEEAHDLLHTFVPVDDVGDGE